MDRRPRREEGRVTDLRPSTYLPRGPATTPAVGLSLATFPATAREHDCNALADSGFTVWEFPHSAVIAICRVGGWTAHVEAAGYDPRHGVERWYSDGSLVVYTHVRLPPPPSDECTREGGAA